RGLSGKQAAWANRKYRGHRTLPDSILKELDDKQIAYPYDSITVVIISLIIFSLPTGGICI
ncbi:hypothetical protein DFH29DRAFT_812747, partial [Suillus ampliporus]